jgi:hypothetical protein
MIKQLPNALFTPTNATRAESRKSVYVLFMVSVKNLIMSSSENSAPFGVAIVYSNRAGAIEV